MTSISGRALAKKARDVAAKDGQVGDAIESGEDRKGAVELWLAVKLGCEGCKVFRRSDHGANALPAFRRCFSDHCRRRIGHQDLAAPARKPQGILSRAATNFDQSLPGRKGRGQLLADYAALRFDAEPGLKSGVELGRDRLKSLRSGC